MEAASKPLDQQRRVLAAQTMAQEWIRSGSTVEDAVKMVPYVSNVVQLTDREQRQRDLQLQRRDTVRGRLKSLLTQQRKERDELLKKHEQQTAKLYADVILEDKELAVALMELVKVTKTTELNERLDAIQRRFA